MSGKFFKRLILERDLVGGTRHGEKDGGRGKEGRKAGFQRPSLLVIRS